MTNLTFEEFIRGKNVIIVGPSPNITGKKLGDKIDDYDVVIRMNGGFPVQQEHQEDYGKRCDVLYANGYFTRMEVSKRIPAYEDSVKFICHKTKKPDVSRSYKIIFRDWDKNVQGSLAGIHAINEMIQLKAASVTVTGMDMFQDARNPYIKNYLPQSFTYNFAAENRIHDYAKCRSYFNNLIRRKAINVLENTCDNRQFINTNNTNEVHQNSCTSSFRNYSIITKDKCENEKSSAKIAVLLQMYWIDLWPEYKKYLSNITDDYDLYVSLVRGSFSENELNRVAADIYTFKRSANILLVDNRGLDIGAVFMTMKKIISDNIHYDYYLKLHTKKSLDTRERHGKGLGGLWRKELVLPICGSKEAVHNSLQLLKISDVGLVGSNKWLRSIKTNPGTLLHNGPIIQELIEELKMKNVSPNDCVFIGGTMFWVDGNLWEQFFKTVDIDKFYGKFCTGKFTDYTKGTYTHAMERFIGLYVTYNKKRILGI